MKEFKEFVEVVEAYPWTLVLLVVGCIWLIETVARGVAYVVRAGVKRNKEVTR